jgi:hypothetical protein
MAGTPDLTRSAACCGQVASGPAGARGAAPGQAARLRPAGPSPPADIPRPRNRQTGAHRVDWCGAPQAPAPRLGGHETATWDCSAEVYAGACPVVVDVQAGSIPLPGPDLLLETLSAAPPLGKGSSPYLVRGWGQGEGCTC